MIDAVGPQPGQRESDADDRLFRALFDSALDAILIADDDRVYVDANPAACELFGLMRHEIVGRRIDDFAPSESVPGTHAAWAAFLERGAMRGEFKVLLPDGTVRECEFNAKANIVPGRHLSILRDVSTRKRAEAALSEMAPRFHAILEQSYGFMLLLAPDGVCIEANPLALEAGGLRREDVVGRPVWELRYWQHSEETQRVLREDVERAGGGDVVRREVSYLAGDGSLRFADRSLSPVRDARGEVVCLVASGVDITHRKRIEDRLREEAAALEAINRISTLIVGEFDLRTIVQTITEETTALTGAVRGAFFSNRSDERGVPFGHAGGPLEAYAGVPMPRDQALLGPTFRGEGVVRLDDVRADPRFARIDPFRDAPPDHSPVRSYLAVPVVSRSGDVLGGMFFGHPDVGVFGEQDERLVTGIAAQAAVAMDNATLFEATRREREAAERARRTAEEANRAKDEFLAVVSHELRTPLNAMLGWTRMLRGGELDAATTAHALEVVERNTLAQAQLIEDLLDVSRIITGKLRLDVADVDLARVVDSALDAARTAASAKGITISVAIEDGLGPVSGDAERLQQVVWNLVSNAVKFTSKGGRVVVGLRRVDSHAELAVADTGVGIAPEFLPYVFDRFRQADGGTTRQHGGLGLGLAIVRSITELHGGTVRVESEGVGRGATFTVSLPLPAVDGAAAERMRHEDASVVLDGVRVLVVEDEFDSRELMKAVLIGCGATVEAVETVDAALAAFSARLPDVIVSDIGLPGEDGYSFIERVRMLEPEAGGRVPAIALTAYVRPDDRSRAFAAGFGAHLSKPIGPMELAAAVSRAVSGDLHQPNNKA